MFFDTNDFSADIICENDNIDAVIRTERTEKGFSLYLQADISKPKFIEIKWSFSTAADTLVLGDAWERSYGELGFRKISENKRFMPWYFLAVSGSNCFCFGVKTQPSSFVCFEYCENGIAAKVDCRNGGSGVHLGGREICLCEFIYSEYEGGDVFANLCDYCRKLCPSPLLPKLPVYGGNNWYYAYGKSSYDEIVSDAEIQAEMAGNIENRPFEVVDDGWQLNPCAGPWVANNKFKDMKALANDIKSAGARPGIWVRLLNNRDNSITDDMKIDRNGITEYLDPTVDKVKTLIINDIKKIKSWGYELLKHDFSTVDLFGKYGKDLTDRITVEDGWHFHDKTKTNAEIVLDLYRLIKDSCSDMLIIGCNTVSHLCAGLVQINRTGDDTSGKEWSRTKKMGINTLAFRLAQNNAFYMVDADCIGICGDCVPWEKNSQWLDLVAHSGTALFISCNKSISDKQKTDIKNAFIVFDSAHSFKPVDWFESDTPENWQIDGIEKNYSW